METYIIHAILFLSLIASTDAASLGNTRKCQENSSLISCTYENVDSWDFREFRRMSDRVLNKNIALNISCNDGGSIILPWPMKANNLKRISITNCLLKDYFSEYLLADKHPDSLVDVYITDCAIETDIREIIYRARHLNSTSKAFDCGQETVVNYAIKNMTYVFKSLKVVPSMELVYEAFEALKEQSKTKVHTCNYDNMVYLDQSISDSRSVIYFDTLTGYSFYPSLKIFNFSTNLLPRIPPQLYDWSQYFPSLEELDLSNNRLQTFSFAPSVSVSSKKLFVNMQHNLITQIPGNMSSLLRADSQVLVDLRNNPIDCSCNVAILKSYFANLVLLEPTRQDLTRVKCSSPSQYQGKMVMDIQNDSPRC